MKALSISYNEYLITTDKNLLQVEAIHKWLSEESYWAKEIPFEIVKGSFDNSYTIGILKDKEQVGYARLVTDYTTFAYLADVYIVAAHRGKGLSKIMLEILFNQDWVKGLRRIMLATKDAQLLYSRFGFTSPQNPDRLMELTRPAIYETPNKSSN